MIQGRVHFLPETIDAGTLAGGVAVVIDVLRATTTVCHALAAGALDVRPCPDVEVSRMAAEALGRERTILGGERGGTRIDGFDLGNSPAEYTAQRVAGKSIVFSTTNGTRAIDRCRAAEQIVLAALVNRGAVCRWIERHPASLDIVCAGTEGAVTREDILAAGAIVERLTATEDGPRWVWNDEAMVARDAWRGLGSGDGRQEALVAALRSSRGGRNLIELGYDADIEAAAQLDRLDVVPYAGEVLHFVDILTTAAAKAE